MSVNQDRFYRYTLWVLLLLTLSGCGGGGGQGSNTPPNTPDRPSLTVASNQITVTWSAVSNATSYEVWYHDSEDPGAAQQVATDTNTSDTHCVITGLTNGTTYYIWIVARNNFGASGFSQTSSATPNSTAVAPGAPNRPSLSAGNGQLTVVWSSVTGATSYEVWYHTSSNSSAATRFNGDSNETDLSCIITGLTNGITYYVWVKAKNDNGTSDFSPMISGQPSGSNNRQAIIIDHTCTDLTRIPQTWIQAAKTDPTRRLRIAYGHTSHGSQITTGMSGLVTFINGGGLGLNYSHNFFDWNSGGTGGALELRDYFVGGDLGNATTRTEALNQGWIAATRNYLQNNNTVNVVIWSWCGGVSEATEEGINGYLEAMSGLEQEFPGVTFVYMTGHLDGSGANGNLNRRNQQIRDYCRANNKVLYDFADIESYDPDGVTNYMLLMANDNCDYISGGNNRNWAVAWQNAHPGSWYNCESAHSQPLNANRKAYAAWWLWARLAGWDGD